MISRSCAVCEVKGYSPILLGMLDLLRVMTAGSMACWNVNFSIVAVLIRSPKLPSALSVWFQYPASPSAGDEWKLAAP